MTSADTHELGLSEEPPPPAMRLRRRKLPVLTLCLALAAAAGAGFFAGVRVEKAQLKPTSSGNNAAASLAAELRQGAGANTATTGAGNARSISGGATPAPTSGTAGTSGVANIVGTVTVVQGNTLYITEASGDTVKVTTSDGTTVTKNVTGAVKDLSPGETVVVRGVQSSEGVYAAQSVTQGSAGAGGFGGFGGRNFGQGRGTTGTAQPTQSPKAGG